MPGFDILGTDDLSALRRRLAGAGGDDKRECEFVGKTGKKTIGTVVR